MISAPGALKQPASEHPNSRYQHPPFFNALKLAFNSPQADEHASLSWHNF
jgi:hypothetical protein